MDPNKSFKLNPSQVRLSELVWETAGVENILAYGPARSGKTAGITANIATRAMMFPGTKHGIFRRTRRAAMFHLFKGTFPEVMKMLYPGYLDSPAVKTNSQDGTVTFHNGSQIVFDGIDPNDIERILGPQYATAWINECNELEDYAAVDALASRMADFAPLVDPSTGKLILDSSGSEILCRPLMIFDCNPDLKTDWDHRCFVDKVNPNSGKPWGNPVAWRRVFMPSKDNELNLVPGFLNRLADRYDGSPAMEERFLKGLWRDDNPNALFRKNMFLYCEEKPLEYFRRVIVGVDPSGGAGNNSDYTGIVVVGLGLDGLAYVLEDGSVQGLTSEVWAKEVIRLYDKWNADYVVAERNFGGDMVATTIKSARRNIEPILVTASRGKIVRAGPVAQKYMHKKVIHMGSFKELEAQMCDYKEGTKKSPDRMDALVWALTRLLDLNGDERDPVPGAVQARSSGRRN